MGPSDPGPRTQDPGPLLRLDLGAGIWPEKIRVEPGCTEFSWEPDRPVFMRGLRFSTLVLVNQIRHCVVTIADRSGLARETLSTKKRVLKIRGDRLLKVGERVTVNIEPEKHAFEAMLIVEEPVQNGDVAEVEDP